MPMLLIHGGAGSIEPERRDAYRRGLEAALAAGYGLLSEGGDAVEAVLRAVETMEANEEAFNAGIGGSPNRDGDVELDAAVVRGRDGSAGGVAAVRTAPSAVRLADLVRRETPHALLVGAGADALVSHPIDPARLLTAETRAAHARWVAGRTQPDAVPTPTGSATVGAVALDDRGDLAAATSTGGMLGKWPGRVGDAPIVGAGTYADRIVAVSCTGKGEAFIRAVTGKAIAERLAGGGELRNLVARALEEVRAMEGNGGIIALTHDGRLAFGFDTSEMAVGWRSPHGSFAEVASGGQVVLVEP